MVAKNKNLGFGLGLRAQHYDYILEYLPDNVDWFEIISEDYMVEGGASHYYLEKIREHYPIVMHGVSLSIGSTDPLNWDYLTRLKQLKKRIQPCWLSDHLCWTGVGGHNSHDLLPLPYTQEAIDHVVQRVQQVQDFLDEKITLENVSSYIQSRYSEMGEADFLSEIAHKSGCNILLDINNVYVSAFNNQFNAVDYIKKIPKEKVQQFHLAGHCHKNTHIIDTHDAPIISDVWDLYRVAIQCFGNVSTLIERDDNIPPLPDLLTELDFARSIANEFVDQGVYE